MARSKKTWNDLSSPQQGAVLAVGSVELALTATALVVLAKLPHDEVRGRKIWWAMACLIQPVGPPAFLLFGRKRQQRTPALHTKA